MFETWADRVATVNESESQRALMAEIAVWRARRLTDVPATRQGTWALARLHQQLGEEEKAVKEARQLVSLCQTPPLASKDEVAEARRLLRELGEKAPKMPAVERNNERNKARKSKGREKPEAPRGEDPVAAARKAAAVGHTRKVRKLVGDRKGGVWTALRSWSVLTDGLAGDEAALRSAVEEALADLAGLAGIKGPAPVAEKKAPDETTEGPLAELLGRPFPTKRRSALAVADAFLAEQPDQIDQLASLMLEHHFENAGAGASAAWLSGIVARALVAGGEATKGRLEALQGAGTSGIALFDAWAFHRAVRLGTSATEAGWTVDGLREGVLSRGEPADRRVWTLRLSDASGQRMLAIAPHATEPWPGTLAADIAARTAQLAPAAVVLASGSGNSALRDAAEAAGLSALSEDADDAALLEQLGAQPVVAPRPKAAPKAEAPKAEEPKGPTPPQELTELLGAAEPDTAAIEAVVRSFRRPSSALRVAERAEAPLSLAPVLLTAVHAASDDDRMLPEGTTLALRAAAAGVEGVRELLADGPTAARYGGPGVDAVSDLAAVLVGDGWELFRVLRGTTRREKEKQPVLDTLGEALDGLWRLLVRKGDVKGEVWFLGSLSPEGRAGVPQLLLEDHQRAVVLPVDPELLSWYGELDGPDAIGWTGDEADALREAVAGWSA